MHGRSVINIILPHYHDKKKLFCKFNKIHRRHANKETFKRFFPLKFSKCNSSFPINVQQETFINSIKLSGLRNYFITWFHSKMGDSIRNYYIL